MFKSCFPSWEMPPLSFLPLGGRASLTSRAVTKLWCPTIGGGQASTSPSPMSPEETPLPRPALYLFDDLLLHL